VCGRWDVEEAGLSEGEEEDWVIGIQNEEERRI
jgi:hypothetical protein